MIKKYGFGRLLSLRRNLKMRKELGMIFKTLDDIIKTANALFWKCGKENNGKQCMPQPIMLTLENPMLRFPCMKEMHSLVGRSVAESIYFISGMNSGDFIWEFRDWEDPRKMTHANPSASGAALRFYHEKTGKLLTYSNTNHLRESGQGYLDQFHKAFTHFVDGGESFTFSFHEPERKDAKRSIHSAWAYRRDNKLCLMATCGEVE